VTKEHRVRNEALLAEIGIASLAIRNLKRALRWCGHVDRTMAERVLEDVLQ
jgi:hypothetical protein